MIRLFVCVVVSLLLMVGASALAQNPIQDQSYVIAPEDTISVVVRDVSEASGDFLVRRDGFISHPIAGELKVAGLTVAQATQKLTDALKKELRNPHVTINVRQSTVDRIYVLGAVRGGGILDYKPKWRLTEVIAAAGGLSGAPERTKAILFRIGSPNQIIEMKRIFVAGEDAANVAVQAGDVINFQTDVTVRVNMIGQVGRPGVVEVLEGQGVVEALAAAGGAAPDAKLSGAKVVRHGKEIPINLYEAVVKAHPELNFPVEEQDTIYVPSIVMRVSVIGLVGRPGPIAVPDGQDITLSLAIAEAGGPELRSKTDSVNLIRLVNGKAVTTHFNYHTLLAGKNKNTDPLLQNNDVIFIAESGKPALQDFTSVISSLYFVDTIFRHP